MLCREDEFDMDEYEGKTGRNEASNLGSAGNLTSVANRQKLLEQQRQQLLKKQQMRRGAGGAVQANRAFTGASRKIPMGKTGSQFRNFSAPKAIDPLEGEDDEITDGPIKRTGYADSFRGSSRNVTNYGGIYEIDRPETVSQVHQGSSSFSDPRVANVQQLQRENLNNEPEQPRFTLPNEISEPESKVRDTPTSSRDISESKVQRDLMQRGISSSYDPNPEEEEPVRKSSSSKKSAQRVKKSSTSKSAKSSSTKSSSRSIKRQEEEEDVEEEEYVEEEEEQTIKYHDDEDDEDELEEAPIIPRKKKSSSSSMKKKALEKRESSRRAKASAAKREEQRAPKNEVVKAPIDEFDDEDEYASENEEKEYQTAAISRPMTTLASETPNLDLSNMREFLTQPALKSHGTIQCYIERDRSGGNKLYPEYHLFLKEGDRFLLSAKKRAKQRTANYIFSMDQKDLNRNSGNFIGKLRSNFIGTEFNMYDHGVNPKNADPDSLHVGTTPIREELGVILYASNVLGSRGPRKMKVAVPSVGKDGKRNVNRPVRKSEEILTRFKDRDMSNIVELVNKPPRWNDSIGAYVLNFNGRVTMASVKNFQLVNPDDEDVIILQFGRVGKDLFTMDYASPLSPLQAFQIAMSSMMSKLGCE